METVFSRREQHRDDDDDAIVEVLLYYVRVRCRTVGRSNADAGRSGCARAEQCEYAVNPERVSRKPHISKIEK